jgi:hypothetical protein
MSELRGSEWGNEEAEIRRSPGWDLPWLEEPYPPEGDADYDQIMLDDEEDLSQLAGAPLDHDDDLGPGDRPTSMAERIEVLTPSNGDKADGDHPGQESSSDWAELARDLIASFGPAGDTPFTGDELEMVRSAVRDAQEEITRLRSVNEEQLALMKSLSEQLRSSERIGRKDWLIMAIGAGTALVIAGVVPSAVLLPIGAKFFHAIAHLFD